MLYHKPNKMETINQHSELDKGDVILIRFLEGDTFKKNRVSHFGILRDRYDNKNSLSGCLSEIITIYKISGIIREWKYPRVFCWYKTSFLLLGGEEGHNYKQNNEVEIFKLSKQEALELRSYIVKNKIVNEL